MIYFIPHACCQGRKPRRECSLFTKIFADCTHTDTLTWNRKSLSLQLCPQQETLLTLLCTPPSLYPLSWQVLPLLSCLPRPLIFLQITFFFFFFDRAGSSLLRGLFSSCSKQGLLLYLPCVSSHCGGLSCCRAWTLGCLGFSSCGSWALEHRLNSYGTCD